MKNEVKYDELTDEDLRNRLSEISDELRAARQKVRVGQFRKMADFKRLRRDIARINFYLRARELKKAAGAKKKSA